jgi:hypothetical protein
MSNANAKQVVFDSFSKKYQQFGSIRLRQYDDLLGGEVEEYERQQREQAQAMMELNEISRAIGENPDSGLTAEQAFELLANNEASAELKLSICMRFGPPGGGMATVAAVLPIQANQATRMITLALNSRGTVKVDDEWVALAEQHWNDDDSRALPGKIRNQIMEFMGNESRGGRPAGKSPKKAKEGNQEPPSTPE